MSAVGAAADSASTDMMSGDAGLKIEGVKRWREVERCEIESLEWTNSVADL